MLNKIPAPLAAFVVSAIIIFILLSLIYGSLIFIVGVTYWQWPGFEPMVFRAFAAVSLLMGAMVAVVRWIQIRLSDDPQ